MKRILITTALMATTVSVSAQEPADTITSQELDEVVIEAPKVVRKADMDVYHPSQSIVENSKDGMQLLRNLMIPGMIVNDALGSISASGQAVEVRINGRVSSIEQVKALLPESIKRVEWIDNPGLRYNGADYVLNVIVANPTVGGSLMLNARPALNCIFGTYNGNLKLNHGRSQWEAGVYFKPTENLKSHRDYKEVFTYPDGSSLTRTETPISGHLDNTQGAAWLSYS